MLLGSTADVTSQNTVFGISSSRGSTHIATLPLLLDEARVVVWVPPLVQLALMSFAMTPLSAFTLKDVPLQV